MQSKLAFSGRSTVTVVASEAGFGKLWYFESEQAT